MNNTIMLLKRMVGAVGLWGATLLLLLLPQEVGAQKVGAATVRCDVGFLYEISYQESWGDSYAVVAEVLPNGPAEQAGVKVGDILLAVNGRNTRTINEETLTQLLLNPTEGEVLLEVARLGQPSLRLKLKKECLPAKALSEEQVAKSFNMYSVEDVVTRRFVMPFSYALPSKESFLQYRSFSIGKGGKLDGVEQEVARELERKGLKQVAEAADLSVVVRHVLEQNPHYRAGETEDVNSGLRNYRANARSVQIEEYPFLSINSPRFSGTHTLVIEVDILKRTTGEKLWGVVARERLNAPYNTAEYAKSFMPLLLANFPKVRYVMNPAFLLHQCSYRYTGIHYDATNLQKVAWVDAGSPAERAGIRVGDEVVAINGLPTERSAEKLTKAYKRFIDATWEYRNPSTIFPSDNGFERNMYWSIDKYLRVAEAIQKPEHKAVFSYLFSHRTYIHSPIIKELVFEVKRGASTESILITPELRNHDYITQK